MIFDALFFGTLLVLVSVGTVAALFAWEEETSACVDTIVSAAAPAASSAVAGGRKSVDPKSSPRTVTHL